MRRANRPRRLFIRVFITNLSMYPPFPALASIARVALPSEGNLADRSLERHSSRPLSQQVRPPKPRLRQSRVFVLLVCVSYRPFSFHPLSSPHLFSLFA